MRRLPVLVSVLWLSFSGSALAQVAQEETPPPVVTDNEVPPAPNGLAAPVEAPPPVTTPPPASAYGQQAATGYGQAPYVAQPMTAQPVSAEAMRPTRRGDRLEDTANTGEIVDLMISTGGYGIMVGNAIVDWAPDGTSGVASHFTATVLGATLSLTGLLAIDAPRGVPTTMVVGLRYGLILSGFGYGAFAGGRFDPEALLATLTLGGLVGYGIGAGIGLGGRPHISRTRFVESGGLWGAGLAAMIAGAACANSSRCNDSSGIFGVLLAGTSVGVLAHTLVAFLTPVSAGRGWLLNAAFAGGAGLGAFFTWGLSNGMAAGEYILGIGAATGFVALGVVFAISDGIQDSGWDESVDETLGGLQVSIGPMQDGAMGTLSGSF